MIDPHIQKAMELAREYAQQYFVNDGERGGYTYRIDDARAALESHLLALVEKVRKETIEEMGKDAARLDCLAAWTKGDITICPPGNHGGNVECWLVGFEDDSERYPYGPLTVEHIEPTLRAAIDRALASPVEK